MLRNDILLFLRKMEKEHNITILLAVDSGGRNFGYSSPESDIDVRFIYVNKPVYYYSIDVKPDTIEYMSEDHDLDIVGYNLKKVLGLISKTNPVISDWLHSGSTYIVDEEFVTRMMELEAQYYSPKAAMYHFYSIGVKNNEAKLLKEQTLKRFIYYMRSILACMWIEKNGTHPEVVLDKLIDAMVDDPSIKEKAYEILVRKRATKANDNDMVDSALWDYFREKQLRYAELLPTMIAQKRNVDYQQLSQYLMEVVEKNR